MNLVCNMEVTPFSVAIHMEFTNLVRTAFFFFLGWEDIFSSEDLNSHKDRICSPSCLKGEIPQFIGGKGTTLSNCTNSIGFV